MKKNLNYLLVAIVVSLVALPQSGKSQVTTTDQLLGQINTVTSAVPFLMITPDARSGAMGDAGVATSPDANSQHWNAAKYPFIDKDMGFTVSYVPWLRGLTDDINLAYVSGYKKINKTSAISGSLRYFSLGDIVFTDIVGNVTGQFKPNEFAVDLGYSRLFSDNFAGAVTLRYINSNLTNGATTYNGGSTHAGNSVAVDVGLFYHNDDIRLGDYDATFNVGAQISNIGAKIGYTESTERDFIPTNLKVGPSLQVFIDDYNSISFTFDLNKLLVPTTPVYETDSLGQPVYDGNGDPVIEFGMDNDVGVVTGIIQSFYDAPGGFREEMREINISAGVEYWYNNLFAVRAGYFYEHPTKGNRQFFTLGAGIQYNVFGLDFAYLIATDQRHPLENTLRFTLLFNFDALQAEN